MKNPDFLRIMLFGFLLLPVTLSGTYALANDGARIYAENCASCHGANGEGQANWKTPDADGTLRAPPHDVTGHTWHHADSMLFDYSKYGGAAWLEKNGITGVKSGMPAFKDILSDEEIRQVLGFIKSLWPEKPANYQKRLSAQDAAR